MSINWRKSWFPVWYAFCPTQEDFYKAMKDTKHPYESYPETMGCTVIYKDHLDQKCVLVTFNVDWSKDYDMGIGILVHEVVHVVEAILDHIMDDSPSEEFRAYATQGIFTELRKDIDKYIKESLRLSKRKRKS